MKGEKVLQMAHYFYSVYFVITLITSLIMLYVVISVNKRRDFFYIATPLAFLASSCLGIYIEYRFIFADWNQYDELDYEEVGIGLSVRYMFYTLGH